MWEFHCILTELLALRVVIYLSSSTDNIFWCVHNRCWTFGAVFYSTVCNLCLVVAYTHVHHIYIGPKVAAMKINSLHGPLTCLLTLGVLMHPLLIRVMCLEVTISPFGVCHEFTVNPLAMCSDVCECESFDFRS